MLSWDTMKLMNKQLQHQNKNQSMAPRAGTRQEFLDQGQQRMWMWAGAALSLWSAHNDSEWRNSGNGLTKSLPQNWKAASYHSRYTLRERVTGLWTLILSSILNSHTAVGKGTQPIPQKCLIVREQQKHLAELRLPWTVDNANNVY